VWHGGKSTHPLLGSPLPPPPVCAGLGETAGAPPPRRAGRGRSREPGAAGARTGAAEYIAGVNTCTTGGVYLAGTPSRPEHRRLATDRPATTTPSPHREHRGPSSLFSPLDSFLCWLPKCGDASLLNSCLGAGLRAAELPCRDGWGSWAGCAPELRRRRAKSDVVLCL
jgi:hypothetical protein